MNTLSKNAAFAADGKAADAFRTIGEVSRALGIQAHVLRYWEEQFPMLAPVKRAGGRRLYRPDDVDLIATIDRLVHREGYTLRGARQYLEGKRAAPATILPLHDSPPAVSSPAVSSDGNAALLADLKVLRQRLASALAG